MTDFKAKMHLIWFRLGLRPTPRWGSLQRSPMQTPSWIWGPVRGRGGAGLGKRRERGGRGTGGEGKGGPPSYCWTRAPQRLLRHWLPPVSLPRDAALLADLTMNRVQVGAAWRPPTRKSDEVAGLTLQQLNGLAGAVIPLEDVSDATDSIAGTWKHRCWEDMAVDEQVAAKNEK